MSPQIHIGEFGPGSDSEPLIAFGTGLWVGAGVSFVLLCIALIWWVFA